MDVVGVAAPGAGGAAGGAAGELCAPTTEAGGAEVGPLGDALLGRAPGAAGPAGAAGRGAPAGRGAVIGTAGGERLLDRAAVGAGTADGGGAGGGSGSFAGRDGAELWSAGAGVSEETEDVGGAAVVRSVPACAPAGTPEGAESRRTANTALHTVQRARTPASGTFTGSTRYTVAQFGQVTFIW